MLNYILKPALISSEECTNINNNIIGATCITCLIDSYFDYFKNIANNASNRGDHWESIGLSKGSSFHPLYLNTINTSTETSIYTDVPIPYSIEESNDFYGENCSIKVVSSLLFCVDIEPNYIGGDVLLYENTNLIDTISLNKGDVLFYNNSINYSFSKVTSGSALIIRINFCNNI